MPGIATVQIIDFASKFPRLLQSAMYLELNDAPYLMATSTGPSHP
jgi:hypothetical protein